MDDTPDFKAYEPLPTPSSIRLLSVFREPSEIWSDVKQRRPLQLSLDVVDLENEWCPQYYALSYTWGSPFADDDERSKRYTPEKKWPIIVNGQRFLVTRNLYEFLNQDAGGFDWVEELSDVHYHPYNQTAMMIIVAQKGILMKMPSLLMKGADVGAQDDFGKTALHYAAENGHLQVARELVNWGADIERKDNQGRTPLDCAKSQSTDECASVARYLENPDPPLYAGLSRGWISFWIDAICINQKDVAERSAQVKIMSQIYTKAAQVIVWLGIEDERTALARDALHGLSEGLLEWYSHIKLHRFFMYQRHPGDSAEPRLAARQADAVEQLFARVWFQRAWVVQELALARDVRIFCGGIEISYHSLSRVPHFINTNNREDGTAIQDLLYARGNGIGGIEAMTLIDIRIRTATESTETRALLNGMKVPPVVTWKGKLSLQSLATMTWPFKATDPRDKLYSLLGIARRTGQFTPDYTLPVEDVFTSFARLFLQGSPDEPIQSLRTGSSRALEPLEGLSYVQETSDNFIFKLPSWVPNFAAPLIAHRLWAPAFNASTGVSTTGIIPGDDSHTLSLKGIICDKVVYVEPFFTSTLACIHASWPLMLRLFPSIYPTGESLVRALFYTLMASQAGETSTISAEAEMSFRKFLRQKMTDFEPGEGDSYPLLGLLDECDAWDLPHSFIKAKKPQRDSLNGSHKILDAIPVFSRLMDTYRSRSLFKTEKGYLGVGPESIKRGDEIWIIAGARTPFILSEASPKDSPARSDGGSSRRGSSPISPRRFVGETYIHGIMNGEAIRNRHRDFRPVSLV
ncbi:hypothetical protein ASPWEDRAFT_172709 [Aspergillus wentii DTO 134E9]|uniref:Heterokaryon incompatibility domain-containing protein n=1 Tax=Aspergillus wentii DTO 134E9 TaxID=1073089 RepID=A0A1L9RM01_ASPWE|nr:uncharacterized protein ASPWEDRAFT_172709 [Aspergillus wentii DTO 134E9]KAI9929628.1 hypothetical protein MW887_001102 [Aspergillus wentii]OJJ35924.1 hypothetical protein ASPWEDRAFT_172709 [Aspergillus wentii DTO 134E9]